MSLYSQVSKEVAARAESLSSLSGAGAALSSHGARGLAQSAIAGAAGAAGQSMPTRFGQVGSVLSKVGSNMATNAMMNMIDKHIPATMQRALDVGSRAAGDVMQGDLQGAGMRVMGSGLLENFIPGMSGVVAQERFWGAPTPLFGGISPADAKRLHDEVKGARHARKNLWLIEVSSKLNMGDGAGRFNLFATELDFAPLTLTGEKRRIGSALTDAPQTSEPVELRVTTYDDEIGTLKRWYEAHHAAATPSDGTVGIPGGPAGYAITIKIVYGAGRRNKQISHYESKGYFRPANIECSLSRREDGLVELQMTFSQIETFMVPA